MKYYLVGIKGTGMTALACMLKDLGNFIVGSDTDEEFSTDKILQKKKIEILLFNKNNIVNGYTYIISNAYDYTNEEVDEIILNDYEYYYYHDFIGKVLEKNIISIAGTHGKTTTTSFISQMFNKNASFIIGDGSGYGTNETNYLILESCEYKDHFLSYSPIIGLVTNIELDHPDYFRNELQLLKSFQKFANNSGVLIINNDDNNSKKIKHNNRITYGFDKTSDYQITLVEEHINSTSFMLIDHINDNKYVYSIPLIGTHYIYDFVGAIVVCFTLGITPYIDSISLPKRRMNEYHFGKTILIDDYAHHPTEIRCLNETLRKKYQGYIINVIFQPHTYTRTFRFYNEFKEVLMLFDDVYLTNVFTSKREQVNLQNNKKYNLIFQDFKKFDEQVLKKVSKDKKEVWVFLGAGVVNKYIKYILNENECL